MRTQVLHLGLSDRVQVTRIEGIQTQHRDSESTVNRS